MSYLELANKAEEEYQTQHAGDDPEPAAVDPIVDDTFAAALIDSAVLGAPIWFAFKEDWRPDAGDTTPVFYGSELPFLRTKTPEQLREIFTGKMAFAGGKVRQ